MSKSYLFFCFFIISVYAQAQDLHLLLLDSTQMRSINPAFQSGHKIDIYTGINTLFTSNTSFNDFFVEEGNKYVFKQDEIIENLPETINLYAEAKAEIIHTSIDLGSISLLVGYDQRAYASTAVERELIDLFLNGNAPYIGSTVTGKPRLNAQNFHSLSIGGQLSLEKVNVAVKLNRHWAMAGSSIPEGELSLNTSDDIYQLDLKSNLVLNTHLTDKFNAFKLGKNNGFSVDAGLNYDYGKGSIYIAIHDLGYIDFQKDTYNYKLKASQSFEGIDLAPFVEDRDRKLNIQDTIDKYVQYTETLDEFTLRLPAKMFMGITRTLGSSLQAGVTYHPIFIDENVIQRVTGQMQYRINPLFTAGASITSDTYHPFSVGSYVQLTLAGLHVTASMHNSPSLFDWKSAHATGGSVYISFPLY